MESALNKHKEWKGKIEIVSRTSVNNRDELSHAYTPGVARPCLEIEKILNYRMNLHADTILLPL